MTASGGFTCQTLPVTVWTVVTTCGVVVVTVARTSFIPGLSWWIPSCWPSTVTLALSGIFGKSRVVPSAIFTKRLLPATATTSPLSIFTSLVGTPTVVVVVDCTCALADAAKATSRTEATSITLHLAQNLSEFIVVLLSDSKTLYIQQQNGTAECAATARFNQLH